MYIFSLYLAILLLIIANIQCTNIKNENCTILRNNLAEALSNFTTCGIYNSRPITLCVECVDHYLNIQNILSNMSEVNDNDTACINYFINQDRLEIVESLYGNAFDLWKRAKCYECFETVNGKLTNNSSPETIKFLEYYNTTMQCINNTNHKNVSEVCSNCMSDYLQLDAYYVSISNENEKIGVCMDIVDLMNNTRKYWSENCCKFRRHNETFFLLSASTILIMSALFYVVIQWCSEKQAPVLVQQPRFAASLNSLST